MAEKHKSYNLLGEFENAPESKSLLKNRAAEKFQRKTSWKIGGLKEQKPELSGLHQKWYSEQGSLSSVIGKAVYCKLSGAAFNLNWEKSEKSYESLIKKVQTAQKDFCESAASSKLIEESFQLEFTDKAKNFTWISFTTL